MLNEFAEKRTVYIVTGYTDMRKSIDGLAAIVQGKLQLDPYSQALFLFCGRSANRMKGLLWDGDGFLLLYKRLDNGRYRFPRTEGKAATQTICGENSHSVLELSGKVFCVICSQIFNTLQ